MCQPTVTYVTRRRIRRVGVSPVLEVTVTYPTVHGEELSPSAEERFSIAYTAMSEALLGWADGEPTTEAERAFEGMGSAAPYRFDRRIITCDMTVEEVTPDRLTVRRTLTVTTRRGGLEGTRVTATDVWRLPEMTLCVSPDKSRKKSVKSS